MNPLIIRKQFPILENKVHGKKLIYFDNAASTQKPLSVIDTEMDFYKYEYSSVHRGVYSLSTNATNRLENIRIQISKFINASSEKEIVFLKNATEGINLVSNSWGYNKLRSVDNIIITIMEHHSNIVPWQLLSLKIGFEIRVLNIKPSGELNIDQIHYLIDKNTKLLAITEISNVLGLINPLKEIISIVKDYRITTLVDGSQAILHKKVDVQDLNCDFYVFSAHKIYGPSGVGVLYGKYELLINMPPWQGGGGMIKTVYLSSIKKTTWLSPPHRFEAGTLNVSGIIGLGAALKWFQSIDINLINKYERKMYNYAMDRLSELSFLKIYSLSKHSIGIISFNFIKKHAYDVGIFLNNYGIAIRTGHHCAMPLMKYYGVSSMCRISFALYNIQEEIDKLIFYLSRIHYLLNKY
ncbi:SufS family cysteine desulfurase [Candidatus Purcelliella pentastirinorum]|uniref:Cysteine desulfurase n=1 Tax=Candidatus Purcelliella pentastirinorum TaxID=472834 RepID=A0AAX3N9J8_9ENTR|nr:SufS family cysteine desulfurase [Candidatus Purcelliella pentastirinorum]WDI78615.1 SufS family cysteine desulfurase [Candidatus Purcelliella pentastirinorum]WDR80357.1 SufS family cysteine desulfurase [Candidatus Purcelliella pentastirinorum]